MLYAGNQENKNPLPRLAEYVASSEDVSEIISVKELLKLFVIEIKDALKVYEDNSGAISIAKNGNLTKNSKHIEVHGHYVQDYITNDIHVIKVDSNRNIADIFTEALCKDKFLYFRKFVRLIRRI